MGLFAFNNKTEPQPFYFLKLGSKWMLVNRHQQQSLQPQVASGPGQQVKTGCVLGNIHLQRVMIFTCDPIQPLQRWWQALPN